MFTKIKNKLILYSLIAVIIFSFVEVSGWFNTSESGLEIPYPSDKSSSTKSLDSLIPQPIFYQTEVIYNNTKRATFVLYEDFPLGNLPENGSYRIIPPAIADGNIWTKIIRNVTDSNYNSYVMRLFGAIKPFTPNPYNQTLYLVLKDETKNQTNLSPLPIIRNYIINEIDVVRKDVPIKFKNEILALTNDNPVYIFGIVYDPKYIPAFFDSNQISPIHVEIDPIGIVDNTTIKPLPSWIKIESLHLPLVLHQNKPDFFAFVLTTKDAPRGSYEIALRENIDQKIFIEQITLTIL